jgi:hypothetical protein
MLMGATLPGRARWIQYRFDLAFEGALQRTGFGCGEAAKAGAPFCGAASAGIVR